MNARSLKFAAAMAALVFAGTAVAEGVPLPEGYTQLGWIQSSGTQWIDTGYQHDGTTVVDLKIRFMALPNNGWFAYYGSRSAAGAADQFGGWICSSGHHPKTYHYGAVSRTEIDAKDLGEVDTETDYVIHLAKDGDCTVDDKFLATGSGGSSGYTDVLFAMYQQNGCQFQSHSRLYYCQIRSGETLVRDFIPCRSASAEVGLWDAVEGKFYGNRGTGRFGASDDPDLLVNGITMAGQWIDTGVRAKSGINSAVDFTFLSSGGSACIIGVRNTYPGNEYGIWANGSGQACLAYGNINTGWMSTKFPAKSRCVVSNDLGRLYLDGKLIHDGKDNAFDTGYNVVVGAYSDKGNVTTTGNRAISGIFYGIKIEQDGVAVRDLVPGIEGGGRVGFLDRLNGYKCYANLGTGSFAYDPFAYAVAGSTLVAHEGVLKPEHLAGYSALEKDGVYALDASAVTDIQGPLTLTAGTYSLADGAVKDHNVTGTLTLNGGAKLAVDLTADGCDRLLAESVSVEATEEAPFVIQLKPCGAPPHDVANAPVVIRGVNASDLAKFRVETNGGTAALAVRDGDLVVVTANPALPSGYTALDWIASDGHQYVKTGVDMTRDMQVEMNFRVNRYVHLAAFFGTDAWANQRYLFDMQGAKFAFHGVGADLPEVVAGADASVRVGKGTISLTTAGATKTVAADTSLVAANRELAVFAINNGTYGAPFRLYSLTIRGADGRALRDFVPCRTATGENGLWDLVAGEFHPNLGTGRFADSDDTLVNVTDIRSVGSEYIVTDCRPTERTVATMDMAFEAANYKCGLFGQWYEQTDGKYSFGVYLNGSAKFASVLTCGKGDSWLSNQKQPYASKRYLVTLDAPKKLCTVLQDGVSYDSMQHSKPLADGTQTTDPINLFWSRICDNANPDTRMAAMRLYSMQIKEQGELVRDYWPCRTADGLLGVEDRQNGHAFFGNAATKDNAGFYWDGIAYLKTGETSLDVYEGTLAADHLTGITSVRKVGYHALDASGVASVPALTLERGVFSLADGRQTALTVAGALTLKGGARLKVDLLKTGIDTLKPASLAFADATEETPVIIDLEVETGADLTQTYTLVPSGVTGEAGEVKFVKVVSDNAMVCEIKDGALVLRVADVTTPIRAEWTGDADSRVDDPQSWTCYNGQGDVVPGALPTEKTTVVIPDGSAFNCPAGSAFSCKDVVFPAYLGSDCDWTGLGKPIVGVIDLRGHRLDLASAGGTGLIYDSAGLEPVDWVASTGAQCVNVGGYRHKANTRIECVLNAQQSAQLPPSKWIAAFGARNSDYSKNAFAFYIRNGSDRAIYARTGSETAWTASFPYDRDVRLVCEGQTATMSDAKTGEAIGTVTTSGTADAGVNDFFVFDLNSGGPDAVAPFNISATMKLASFKITEDGVLMRDLKPKYSRATGEYGLYDEVTHRFYASITQTKLAGPEVAAGEQPAVRGEVHVNVPEGVTQKSTSLDVDGSVKLVKEGKGELVWNGGLIGPGVTTAVAGGCFKVGTNDRAFSAGGEIVVTAPGRFDYNYQGANGGNSFVLRNPFYLSGEAEDGLGVLVNTGNANWGQHLSTVNLTGDATISGPGSVYFRGPTAFDAHGHTLTIKNTPRFVVASPESSFVAARIVVSENAVFQPCSGVLNALQVSDGVELVEGGTLAFYDSAAAPWTFPVTVGAGGGALRAEPEAGGTRTYALGAPLTVTEGATLTLNCKPGSTSAGTLTRVVNEGTIVGASGQTTTFAGMLSGNGAITGAGLKFGGDDSCWHVALDENGFTERINLDEAPGDFLAGLARLDVTCVPGEPKWHDLCPAGTLTADQVKKIVVVAHDADGATVGGRLELQGEKLRLNLGDESFPRTATWTNAKGDGDLSNPANWACYNVSGKLMAGVVPTADTTVTLPSGIVFNCTNNAPFDCKEIIVPDASLAGDSDWRGLNCPINSTIDLRGHRLTVSRLAGDCIITNSLDNGSYQRLHYVKSNSRGEYIDLELTGKDTTHWELDVCVESTGGSAMILGERAQGGASDCCGLWVGTNGRDAGRPAVCFGALDSGYAAATEGILGARCMITNCHGQVFRDGRLILDGSDSSTFTSSVTMGLFALHTAAGWENTGTRVNTTRVYSLRIFEGETLVRDLMPARRLSDGKVGFVDRAHGDKFYWSGDVGLTAGPVAAFDDDTCGELHIDVPAGQTAENASVMIAGTVKLVKEGEGTYVPTKGTAYSGGTEIVGGTIRCAGSMWDFLGIDTGKVRIDKGATLDLDGYGNVSCWKFVLNGGTIKSERDRGETGGAHLQSVELTDDSTIQGWGFGFVGGSWGVGALKMNDSRLTIDVTADGREFYMGNLEVTGGGVIELRGDGWCCLGGNASSSGKFVHAPSTTLATSGCAVRMKGGELLFGGYTATGSTSRYATPTAEPILSAGRVKPFSQWADCRLLDGATLDLSESEADWTGVCAFPSTKNTGNITFAPGATIKVDLGDRVPKTGARVIAWEAGHAPENVTFKSAPTNSMFGLRVREDGLYVVRGLVIILE